MAAKQRQSFEEDLEEQLTKIDPATLQYLDQLLAQNPSAVQDILENVLDETPNPPLPPPKKKSKKRSKK